MKRWKKSNQGFTVIELMVLIVLVGFICYGFGIGIYAQGTAQDMAKGARIIRDIKEKSLGQVKEISIDTLPSKSNEYVESVTQENDTIVLTYRKNLDREIGGTKVDFSPLRSPDGKIVKWTCKVEGDPITSYHEKLQGFCEYM
jgi:type II secretory pathway pseudopilin PulG